MRIKKYLKVILFLSVLLYFSILDYSFSFSPSSPNLNNGIDISSYQGIVDFEKVKKTGIDFVYIKASEGTSYINPYLDINYNNARKSNIKIGFYHYVSARNTKQAIAEAEFFNNVIKGKYYNMMLAMDFEDFGTLKNNEINAIATAFLQRIENLTSKKAVLYSNTFSAKSIFSDSLVDYPLWIAEYGVSSPNPNYKWNTWVGWQYSNKGTVNGINGFVDLNKFTKDVLLDSYIPESKTTYIVEKGDTLSKIAIKFNTSVSNILYLNPSILNPNLIYPGQKLTIDNNVSNIYIIKKRRYFI